MFTYCNLLFLNYPPFPSSHSAPSLRLHRTENSSLRALLNTQHEDGQHAALEQLSALKEEEKDEIRTNAEKNLAILQTKVT